MVFVFGRPKIWHQKGLEPFVGYHKSYIFATEEKIELTSEGILLSVVQTLHDHWDCESVGHRMTLAVAVSRPLIQFSFTFNKAAMQQDSPVQF